MLGSLIRSISAMVFAAASAASPWALPQVYLVTTDADSGVGSLRTAIANANRDGEISTIRFAGDFFIQPLSALPGLASDTTIDATSRMVNGEPGVTIDGSRQLGAPGFQLSNSNCRLLGMRIQNWAGGGSVLIDGEGNCSVQGCVITQDPTATNNGIVINGSPNNLIGGSAASQGNTLFGNVVAVFIFGAGATGNRVIGNRIGPDLTGALLPGNSTGVAVATGADETQIGGPNPGEGNLIAGNGAGVNLLSASNVVQGNVIGPARTGQDFEATRGIQIVDFPNNLIGGGMAGEANTIFGFGIGIAISGEDATGNQVIGNRIGPDSMGGLEAGNGTGISTSMRADETQIGGPNAGEGNLIAGNRIGLSLVSEANTVQGNIIGPAQQGSAEFALTSGLIVGSGTTVLRNNIIGGPSPFVANGGTGPLGAGNVIRGNGVGLRMAGLAGESQVLGNIIGLDVDGATPAPNGVGVLLRGLGHQVGGPGSGEANVISGNLGSGISLETIAAGMIIQSNIIGMDVSLESARGNLDGVTVTGFSDALIGGDAAGLGNLIAGNLRHGIVVKSGARDVRITRNSIHSNGGIGIDIGGDGVTPNNSPEDFVQNFPVELEAHFEGSQPRVGGELHSTPNTTFTIDLYSSDEPDPSGHGEGQRFLGSFQVMTDSSGDVIWLHPVAEPLKGRFITATASTHLFVSRYTSEFSPSVLATGIEPTPDNIADGLLGLVPVVPDFFLNEDEIFDVADLVTSVNASP